MFQFHHLDKIDSTAFYIFGLYKPTSYQGALSIDPKKNPRKTNSDDYPANTSGRSCDAIPEVMMNYQPKLHALVLRGFSLKNYPYISIKFDPSQIGHLKKPLNPTKAQSQTVIYPPMLFQMLSGAQDFAPWRCLSWGETTHILAFRAPTRMQGTHFSRKKTHGVFSVQEVEIHHCCWYGWINFLVGFNFFGMWNLSDCI